MSRAVEWRSFDDECKLTNESQNVTHPHTHTHTRWRVKWRKKEMKKKTR